ncbi:butyrophilin subfamily 3 member A1-like [Mustelus asterias]
MSGWVRPWVLSLILLLHSTLTVTFQISCLQHPIVVEAGATTVLECQLIPKLAIKDFEVRWTKGNGLVHLYRFGQDENMEQDASYKDRTQLFASEFQKGNVSLKLTNVQLEDEGEYKCLVDTSTMEYQDAAITLSVASLGKTPSINLVKYTANGIQLLCESGSWYPSPEVEWKDKEGKALAQQNLADPGPKPKSMITVKTYLEVTSGSGNTFSCSLRSTRLKRTVGNVFCVPDEFYPRTSSWLYAFLLVFFGTIALIVGLFLFYRKQKKHVREYVQAKDLNREYTFPECSKGKFGDICDLGTRAVTCMVMDSGLQKRLAVERSWVFFLLCPACYPSILQLKQTRRLKEREGGKVFDAAAGPARSGFGVSLRMSWRIGPWALSLILLLRIHSALTVPDTVFKVTGPKDPVIAMIGGVAVLECQLIPEKPVAGMELQWVRSDLDRHIPIRKYTFGSGVDKQQAEAYMNRTEFFETAFNQGNVSLKVKDVRLDDEGEYLCMVEQKSAIEQTSVKLTVASFGQRPALQLDGYHAEGIGLQCNSSRWYPPPELRWVGEDGMTEKARTRTVKGIDGLFSISSTVEVTSGSTNTFSCLVSSVTLKRSQESSLNIPDEFFPRMSKFFTAFILLFILFIAILGAAAFYQYREWKNMEELRKRPSLKEFKAVMDKQSMLQVAVDNIKSNLHLEKDLCKTAAERVISAAVPVTFDPETANPFLAVSKDQLTVTFNDSWQELPQNSRRFNSRLFLIAREGCEAGSQYWEVLVGSKPDWDLGVVKGTISRDDWVTLSPENGFWTIGKRGHTYEVNSNSPDSIPCPATTQKIGIYLNYEEGMVRFYSADDMVPIYSFTTTFTEKIYPFFSPWGSKEEMKISPL